MTRVGRRLSPVLVFVLMAVWLLLNQTLAPAQIALGLALSLALTWLGSTLRPLQASMRRLDLCIALFFIVFWDIIRSNIAVARIVLGLPGSHGVCSAFVEVPLELRDDHGLAVLACIVTSTPGTVWAGLAPDRSTVTLHVLDLKDEREWIDFIKRRYESRLLRIFE